MQDDTIPVGLCQCGCGGRAPIAKQSRPERGFRRGEPQRFILGHNNQGRGVLGFDAYDERDLGYDTPCWIYRRVPDGKNYAQMRMPDGSQPKAHRAFYEHHLGPIPAGMTLDHLCHTATECEGGPSCPHRRCVNPAHMEVVSKGDNARRGKRNKLTAQKATEIRSLLTAGQSVREIASAYGVSARNINHIRTGATWNV